MTDLDRIWFDRHQATGRAQSRYLWLALVLGIFYGALHVRLLRSTQPISEVTFPFVGLPLDAGFVWASGPLVLSFVVLVIFGALRAHKTSRDALKLELGADREAYDLFPNAIDLAMYTTEGSHIFFRVIGRFAYVLFLSVILIEAVWVGASVGLKGTGPVRFVLLGIALLFWLPAAWQAGRFVVNRFSEA